MLCILCCHPWASASPSEKWEQASLPGGLGRGLLQVHPTLLAWRNPRAPGWTPCQCLRGGRYSSPKFCDISTDRLCHSVTWFLQLLQARVGGLLSLNPFLALQQPCASGWWGARSLPQAQPRRRGKRAPSGAKAPGSPAAPLPWQHPPGLHVSGTVSQEGRLSAN